MTEEMRVVAVHARLRQFSDKELKDELALRKAAADQALPQPVVDALAKSLRACAFALDRLPDGRISDRQLKKAQALVFELAYRCLPGGHAGSEVEESCGIDHGWKMVGEKVQRQGRFSFINHDILARAVGTTVSNADEQFPRLGDQAVDKWDPKVLGTDLQ